MLRNLVSPLRCHTRDGAMAWRGARKKLGDIRHLQELSQELDLDGVGKLKNK